jgi:dihydrofolate synthase / folylpolyglutamate synthase
LSAKVTKKMEDPASPARKTGMTGKKAPPKTIKTYAAALQYLDSLVNYERRPPTQRERNAMTLARTKRMLADLDNPHKSLRSVHIAGTKGKGSTATMLAQMLQNNGLKVGLFTSPHIMDIRERICVNSDRIAEAELTRLVARIVDLVNTHKSDQPTFFEVMTVMAFQYFSEQKVDIAVVETGLGGRLDATNVLSPEVCAITSISYDHMAQLGSSIEEIAAEKAGIFKGSVPVVSAPQPDSVKKVLKKVATETQSPLHFAGDDIAFSYRFESSRGGGPQARICVSTPTCHFDHLAVPLVGKHQAINCGVAIGVLDQLKNRGFTLDDEASVAGLAKVSLEGRMEMLCEKPRVLVDGAHNAASIEAVMRAIGQNIPYDSMVVIFGCCVDKDINGMLRLIQLGADKIIFTRMKSPRSADPAELAARFTELSGRMAQVAQNLPEALEIAQKAITREDLICVTGSFYLVSEAKTLFASHPHRVKPVAVPVVQTD